MEDESSINPDVVGAPWAKQQIGMPNLCLLRGHTDGSEFNIGDKCGQCPTYVSGRREVHVSRSTDFNCLCMSKEQIDGLAEKGIRVIWEDGYPKAGSTPVSLSSS